MLRASRLLADKCEIEAIICFDAAICRLESGFFGEVFSPFRRRVEELLKKHAVKILDFRNRIKIIPIASRGVNEEIFKVAVRATLRPKRLLIEHTHLSEETAVVREVSPQAMIRYRDNWYLDAFCHLRNDLRSFAVNRIGRAKIIKGRFHRVPDDRMEAFFAGAYGIYIMNNSCPDMNENMNRSEFHLKVGTALNAYISEEMKRLKRSAERVLIVLHRHTMTVLGGTHEKMHNEGSDTGRPGCSGIGGKDSRIAESRSGRHHARGQESALRV